MNIEEAKIIWESIRLEKEVAPIVENILKEYNMTTKEGIKAALRQAVWSGIWRVS